MAKGVATRNVMGNAVFGLGLVEVEKSIRFLEVLLAWVFGEGKLVERVKRL